MSKIYRKIGIIQSDTELSFADKCKLSYLQFGLEKGCDIKFYKVIERNPSNIIKYEVLVCK